MATKPFKTSKDLSLWLEKNHSSASELWIKIYKKASKKTSVSWNDVVLECLCWGWIDGVKKSGDAETYIQRITPRKPNSAWSKRNTEHVERLISEGRMQEAGMVQVREAKADGRWKNAYAPPSETEVPGDFIAALSKKPKAAKFFNSLNKSSRYVITYALTTAKREETRERRFKKYLNMMVRQETPDFGFNKKK